MKKNKAVFLDRDGTLLTERGYLADPKKIYFYPQVFEALKLLQRTHYKLILITNQSGVARGYFSLKTLEQINRRFLSILRSKGIRMNGIYFCPHGPHDGCFCRKPNSYLAKQAAKKENLDLKQCFVIGDQWTDMKLANNLKIPGVMVLTGAGRSVRKKAGPLATKITSNILTASKWVLSHSQFR